MADKKGKVLNPRVDTSKFPREWLSPRTLPKPEPLDMNIPMGEKLPRIKVVLQQGKDLKKDSFISIKIGNTIPVAGSLATKKIQIWNEEFIVRVEPGNKPFMCLIEQYVKGGLGKGKQYVSGVSVDLFDDLGMKFNGDIRRWSYPLEKGEVTITFEALGDIQLPQMKMPNLEGKMDTSSLATKRPPEIQFTIYQAIRLNGEKPLVSQIELYHRTYDLISNLRLEACLMRTPQFRGYSPYWGDKIIVPINTKNDSIFIIMKFLLGKEEKGVVTVVELFVDELVKLATATESRRWYAFTDFFLGGCLGVGIQALSNMSVLGSLPLLNVPKAIDASKKQSVVMPAKKEESKKQDGPAAMPATALTIEELRAMAKQEVAMPAKALTIEELRAMAKQEVHTTNAPKERALMTTMPIKQAQLASAQAKEMALTEQQQRMQKIMESM